MISKSIEGCNNLLYLTNAADWHLEVSKARIPSYVICFIWHRFTQMISLHVSMPLYPFDLAAWNLLHLALPDVLTCFNGLGLDRDLKFLNLSPFLYLNADSFVV